MLPYFGWLFQHIFEFETSKDGNLLLILEALVKNSYVELSSIYEPTIEYLISKMSQSPDLSSPILAGFEMTIQGMEILSIKS